MKKIEILAAAWLHRLGLIGLLTAVAMFLLYGFGILEADIPIVESMRYWGTSLEEYHDTNPPDSRVVRLQHLTDGGVLATAALAFLVSASIPTLLALSIVWFRKKDLFYSLVSLAIAIVLSCAVLGITVN